MSNRLQIQSINHLTAMFSLQNLSDEEFSTAMGAQRTWTN
jgi:hypothetical protein